MDAELASRIIELGGTVVVVFGFLWYLRYRNNKQEKAMGRVVDALDTLHSSQERHTKILMRVADNHGMKSEVDDLIRD